MDSELLRRLNPPWIYVVKYASAGLMVVGLILLWTYVAATPVGELDLGGRSLPASWKYAIHDHGRYFEAFAVADHPRRLYVALPCVLAGALLVWWTQTAIRQQLEAGGEPRERQHRWMEKAAFFVALFIACVVLKYVLVGTQPA